MNSLQYTAGENLALQFRGGDTVRGNKRALDISRHHCISRNLLLFASRQDDGQNVFQLGSGGLNKKKQSKWTVERQSSAAARSECFLHNVKQVLLCILHASAGEVREKRGGERSGEGGQQEKEEEEELEGFDAMQTGSTKARRQKFSIHHKNKSARVPALAQSDCKDGRLVTKPLNSHRVTFEIIYRL